MAEYKNALVTYLDILGFKKLLDEKTADEILYLLTLMKEKGDIKSAVLNSDETTTVITSFEAFSDHIIRQIEYEQVGIARVLGIEMAFLSRMQFELLTNSRESTLVRGGVSKGRSYMNDDFVFGPAMVKSYELEQIAKFPRIVIDRELVRELLVEERPGWKYILQRGEDGVFFIDYLNAVIQNKLFTPTEIEDTNGKLAAHKKAAEQKLAELMPKKQEDLKQKSLWLAQYHNSVVKQLMADNAKQASELKPFLIAEEKLI